MLRNFALLVFCVLAFKSLEAQTQLGWMPLPSESSVTNGPTNGMWFTSPADITIKALKVPDDSMNPWNPQSIAVLKFSGSGASGSPATNYTVLFLVQDTFAGDSIPCDIPISSGDHIGILGSRWNASSNVGQCSNAGSGGYSTTINGYATPLYKLQANSPLNNQAPSNVYMPSTSIPITRVEVYFEGCELPFPDGVDVSSLLCYGDSNGAVSASISGSLGPYVMEWSNGDSNVTSISNLGAGNYTVTITDSTGCKYDTTVSVTQPDSLYSTSSFLEPLCFGDANGSVTASPYGGIPPYDFSWSNGGTLSAISNVLAGQYTLTLSDSNGCESITTYDLEQPGLLAAVADTIVHNACPEGEWGEIWTNIEGGVGPFTSVWDDPATTSGTVVFNLPSGTYSLSVTDFNECTAIYTESIIALNQNPTFDLGPSQELPQSGVLTVHGPAGMTDYFWSTGSTNDFIFVVTPGLYWLHVTDSNTCTSSDSIEVLPYTPAGIGATTQRQFEVFPSPSSGQVQLQSVEGYGDLVIHDLFGSVVFKKQIVAQTTMLDLSALLSGRYTLHLNGEVAPLLIIH